MTRELDLLASVRNRLDDLLQDLRRATGDRAAELAASVAAARRTAVRVITVAEAEGASVHRQASEAGDR